MFTGIVKERGRVAAAPEPLPGGGARLRLVHSVELASQLELGASLAVSVRKLGARFDQLITAEDVRSYKPDHDHWLELYQSRQIEPAQQLHIAGSIAHDIRPASELGAITVWVRRGHEPIPDDVEPDLIVQSLAELGDYWRLHYSR